MATRSALAVFLTALMAAGCMREPDQAQLSAVMAVAPEVLAVSPESGDVPRAQWPDSLSGLKPERVYARPEGLYIVLAMSFAGERGLFVPRTESFIPPKGGDPSYTPFTQGAYLYQLKG